MVEEGTLAAFAKLADGLLQLSAAPPPTEAATQAALRVKCDVQCTLVAPVPGGVPCTLAVCVRSIHAVACSSIDGLAGSSVAAVAAGSMELTRLDEGGGTPSLLAHAPGQQLANGRRTPAAQLFTLLR